MTPKITPKTTDVGWIEHSETHPLRSDAPASAPLARSETHLFRDVTRIVRLSCGDGFRCARPILHFSLGFESFLKPSERRRSEVEMSRDLEAMR
jgi:hypothetical protein